MADKNRNAQGRFIKGSQGHITPHSIETKKKIGEKNKGKNMRHPNYLLHHSEETKKKISKSLLGNKRCLGIHQSQETCKKRSLSMKGKMPKNINKIKGWCKGKKLSKEHGAKIALSNRRRLVSEETRKKMSDAHKGEKASCWKGGITSQNHRVRDSFQYRNWRLKIFKRDNFTCQGCKKVGGRLEAHHIKSFAKYLELRFCIDNGVTLCKDCHKQIHKQKKCGGDLHE